MYMLKLEIVFNAKIISHIGCICKSVTRGFAVSVLCSMDGCTRWHSFICRVTMILRMRNEQSSADNIYTSVVDIYSSLIQCTC